MKEEVIKPKQIKAYDFEQFEKMDCQVFEELDPTHQVNEVNLFSN